MRLTGFCLLAFLAPVAAMAQAPRPLELGRTAGATLGASDPQRGGKPYHLWAFAAATRSVQIDMTSDSVDAYLVLQDSAGRFLTADDNSGGGHNARISFDLPAPGRYQVLARSSSSAAGAYTIKVAEPSETTEGIVGAVRRGQELTGSLSATDPKVRTDKPYKAWTFEGAEGDSITIEMRSDAFDSFLILQDAMGRQLAENDDNEEGELHSRLRFRLPRAGRYRILATAFNASAAGSFTLRVR